MVVFPSFQKGAVAYPGWYATAVVRGPSGVDPEER